MFLKFHEYSLKHIPGLTALPLCWCKVSLNVVEIFRNLKSKDVQEHLSGCFYQESCDFSYRTKTPETPR